MKEVSEMSKSEEVRLGLRESGKSSGEERKFERSAAFWYELATIMATIVDHGGAVSVYTSRDSNATAVSIKAGKDRKVYWLGPENTVFELVDKITYDWQLPTMSDVLYPEVVLAANAIADDRAQGDEKT